MSIWLVPQRQHLQERLKLVEILLILYKASLTTLFLVALYRGRIILMVLINLAGNRDKKINAEIV